jgi:hypothetical protein
MSIVAKLARNIVAAVPHEVTDQARRWRAHQGCKGPRRLGVHAFRPEPNRFMHSGD